MRKWNRSLIAPILGICTWGCQLTSSDENVAGAPSSGGTDSAGVTGLGGSSSPGGSSVGGDQGTGGAIATGGTIESGGVPGTGGVTEAAGVAGSLGGGVAGSGGSSAAGGAASPGGAAGAGGGTTITKLPCDIFAADGGPCVAAHSTVRALSSTYTGPIYQVKKADGTTKDIPMLTPGGVADSSVQDAFCGTAACTISKIYDQSGRGNHLTRAPVGAQNTNPGNEADAKALPITLSGHKVYGEHNVARVGYRNNGAKGTATGDNPETEYMIVSGDYYNNQCCFDYGNMEIDSHDDNEGTMEAIYFGNCTGWGKGAGNGPWVMGDLENGLWAGNTSVFNGNAPITYKFITAMVKGDKSGANHWAIKTGNAQTGKFSKVFDGTRPSSRYNPMKKQGGIGLGTGGDASNAAVGNFFEGVMTAAYSSDAADDAVQANIVSAYGQ